MLTKDQICEALARVRGDAVVVTTMAAVRTWARHSASDLDFASADSAMGHAADLALGVALAQPERKVICLNGDGSMLMSLGTLATIVASGARNLVLVVLQNQTYEITGNQLVPGGGITDFAAMALAAGFDRVYRLRTPEEARTRMAEIVGGIGPVFIQVEVEPGRDGPLRRGPGEPEPYLQRSLDESARDLRNALSGSPRVATRFPKPSHPW